MSAATGQEPKLMFTPIEVARILILSPQVVRDMCKTGRIRATPVGVRSFRISRDEVLRLCPNYETPKEAPQ